MNIKTNLLFWLILTSMIISCQSNIKTNQKIIDDFFIRNTFLVSLEKKVFNKEKYFDYYLFRVEPGLDSMIKNELKNHNDIDGAIKYIEIISTKYTDDQKTRCLLNISILYYIKKDSTMSLSYYDMANNGTFSDDTKKIFKKMLVLYPDY